MLSLLKKKSDADAAPAVPAWHPNFRNYQTLPDIKAVRTAFFINGVAILVMLSLAGYLGLQEWQLRGVNAQLAEVQAQVDRDKRVSDQADFVGKLADSLKAGIGSLVDADMEEASARLQALQTQQQLGIQSLSIANQEPSAIMSLFR